MDGESEAAQAGIRANIAGRFFAADVLLAGREREHVAALAGGVDGLAAQAAGHLAEIFLPGREQADIGAAEIEAVADRLALAGDDVGVLETRGFEQAERA